MKTFSKENLPQYNTQEVTLLTGETFTPDASVARTFVISMSGVTGTFTIANPVNVKPGVPLKFIFAFTGLVSGTNAITVNLGNQFADATSKALVSGAVEDKGAGMGTYFEVETLPAGLVRTTQTYLITNVRAIGAS